MSPAPDLRRSEIAKIHVAKKELRLDDYSYRDLLFNVTGKRSAAELTSAERGRLLDRMKQLGFKPKRRRARSWKDSKGAIHPAADDSQSRMARGLWIELHKAGAVRDPSEKALAAFVKRQTGTGDLRWLAPEQRNKVVEGLKSWLARVTA